MRGGNCGVRKWNGSTWNALGSGVDNDVNALVVSGSDLYVGGEFSIAGGTGAGKGHFQKLKLCSKSEWRI